MSVYVTWFLAAVRSTYCKEHEVEKEGKGMDTMVEMVLKVADGDGKVDFLLDHLTYIVTVYSPLQSEDLRDMTMLSIVLDIMSAA